VLRVRYLVHDPVHNPNGAGFSSFIIFDKRCKDYGGCDRLSDGIRRWSTFGAPDHSDSACVAHWQDLVR